ncbi:MAG: hypothetical protein LBS31_12645, partial [Candidatus Adiutrix sp.]|nr:hypothetical protein [Candidatus Adiutrix sp.]
SILENSLAARESELLEMRGQAYALSSEKEELKKALDEHGRAARSRVEEIAVLKKELAEADRDLAENDGRLESSWAALNYLGAKAGDALAKMKARLESQTRQVDGLSQKLKKRDEHIRDLEERQDKLAILYWTLVSKTSGGARLEAVAAPQRHPASPAPETPEAESGEDEPAGGGFGLGRQLLGNAKKTARRSLFALILAGGLVMAPSLPATASTPAAGDAALALSTRMDSAYLGRPVTLTFVKADERRGGRAVVETRLTEKIETMAADWKLSPGEYLRLLRTVRGPTESVHLADFEGKKGAWRLLGKQLPGITDLLGQLVSEEIPNSTLTDLLRAAADFKPYEGLFWDRLFFDFLPVGGDPRLALEGLLSHLARKELRHNWPRPEFAGRLAPFPEIENMGPDTFIKFLADHIKSSWPMKLPSKGRDRAAREAAGAVYFSARTFKLPITFLASLTHQELSGGNGQLGSGITLDI